MLIETRTFNKGQYSEKIRNVNTGQGRTKNKFFYFGYTKPNGLEQAKKHFALLFLLSHTELPLPFFKAWQKQDKDVLCLVVKRKVKKTFQVCWLSIIRSRTLELIWSPRAASHICTSIAPSFLDLIHNTAERMNNIQMQTHACLRMRLTC